MSARPRWLARQCDSRTLRACTATDDHVPPVVVFGAGYGHASLGCTLPLFLTLVAASLTSDGTASSVVVFAAFGSGMGW